jgi:hypothetical protein
MEEGIPQGLKPASVKGFIAKAEALAYLEARLLLRAQAAFAEASGIERSSTAFLRPLFCPCFTH